MLRLRPGLLVPAAVLALGSLLATPAGAAPAEDASVLDSYVALGDSFSAGPLLPAGGGDAGGCLRSGRGFPSLVAQRGGVPSTTDVSCAGATTADVLAPRTTPAGAVPAQVDALTEDTEGVTLTVGAEDAGLLAAVADCAAPEPGAACRDAADGALRQRVAGIGPRVAAVLAAVAERAPDARVLLVGYPALLPDDGSGCTALRPADVAHLRAAQEALDAVLQEQADAAGVEFVDTAARTTGHDLCQPPGVRWVEAPAPGAPVAPTAQGAVELAGEVLAALTGGTGRVAGQRSS